MLIDKKVSAFDDIPINSPEYLKRFQRSFNPAFIQNNQPVCLSSVLLSSRFLSSSLLGGSFNMTSFKFGSFYGSGSCVFCGLGYGIDLI